MMDWYDNVRDACRKLGLVLPSGVVEELAQHAESLYGAARSQGRSHTVSAAEAEAFIHASLTEARMSPRRAPGRGTPPPSTGVGALVDGMWQDIRFGARLLVKQPGFTLAVVVTLALAIGTVVTLFSVTYGVLLKPLPWPDSDRLINVEETRGASHGRVPWTITNATYNAWVDGPQTVEAIGSWFGPPPSRMTLAGSGEVDRVDVTGVTPSLFSSVLRARPLLGRLFNDDDGRRTGPGGRGTTALLSYGLWQQKFGGDSAALGRVIRLDDRQYAIVGVMPRDFAFPDVRTRLWIPQIVVQVAGTTPQGKDVVRVSISQALARLRPGVTASQAATEATARAQAAPDLRTAGVALFGSKGPIKVAAEPALDVQTAAVRPAILVLMVAAMLLFVTAMGSAMGVQLARAATRRRETAIRAAIGAAPGRLARQWVTESLLLTVISAAAGLALAALMQRGLVAWLPADFPRVEMVRMNVPVILFALCTASIASAVCALIPSFQARRVNVLELLTADTGTAVSGGTRAGVARTRALIMAAQVATACVLLVGAGLLTRAFLDLRHLDRGYDPANLLTARLPLPSSYPVPRRVQTLEALQARMRGMAGVDRVAFSNGLPLVSPGGLMGLQLNLPSGESREVGTTYSVVSADYFPAMRMRLIAGRWFDPSDGADTQPALVVNRAFAANLGSAAVGWHLAGFNLAGKASWEIVGVVDDVQEGGSTAPAGQTLAFSGAQPPAMYFSYRQLPDQISADPFLVIRTHEDPAPYVTLLQGALHQEDASLVFDSLTTMEDRIDASLATPRLYAALVAAFGLCALTIALSGLFGVLSYIVANRTKEIGVRTALGATPGDILRQMLRQGMTPAVGGLAAGMLAAAVLASSLSKLLYGVNAHDALTFIAVPVFLFVAALAACAIPARSAAKLDPLRALKS